jgi:hypothetical protein
MKQQIDWVEELACPRCHEVANAAEPTMREASSADGPLIYWRCSACKTIWSRLTGGANGRPENAQPDRP